MIPRYRVWDGQDNIMRIVQILLFPSRSEVNVIIDGEAWALGPDLVLMQSTGLEDKSGIEIFDGDFITDGEERWIVKHFETECGFSAMGIGKTGCWSLYHLANGHKKGRLIEVVGNKYENPELLKFR